MSKLGDILSIEYEYDIEGWYECNWEIVACEPTRAEAVKQRKCYEENEAGIAFRVRKVKVQNDRT